MVGSLSDNLVFLMGSALSIFLVGANLAFLLSLGNRLTRWFTFKVAAITMLLIYVALSLAYGNPSVWRASIALAALITDVFALAWMWSSITHLREHGIQGLIPLGKIDDLEE